MRFYVGQRFIGTVAGERHLFTTTEQYAGGPVEVRQVDGPARFPTAVLRAMVDAGTAVPDHSCIVRPDNSTPAYLLAERCARCQQLSGADEPGGLASLVAMGAAR